MNPFLKAFTPEKLSEAWEIVVREFPHELWVTLYITVISTLFAIIIGLPLGVILVTGEEKGIRPLPKLLMKMESSGGKSMCSTRPSTRSGWESRSSSARPGFFSSSQERTWGQRERTFSISTSGAAGLVLTSFSAAAGAAAFSLFAQCLKKHSLCAML